MTARETHDVELVDAAGNPIGVTSVQAAHTAPGQLHRAFSVLLHDPDGRLLLQQRSATKTRFAGRWANSCCGHPPPGSSLVAAATQRLREELGITSVELAEVGVFTYRATDPRTARVEYEYDHVLTGRVSAQVKPVPEPAEVAATTWVTRSNLAVALASTPDDYAPWLPGVLALI